MMQGLRRIAALVAVIGLALPATGLDLVRGEPDMDRPSPAFCALFDGALKTGAVAWKDYVTTDPVLDVAIDAVGDRLCLTGLPPAEDVRISLREGLPAADGPGLPKATSLTARLPKLASSVRFSGSGFILPRVDTAGVGVDTVNVRRLRVRLLRAGDRLAARLRYDNSLYQYEVNRIQAEDASPVWSGEMDVPDTPNRRVTTSFPLSQAVTSRQPGVYLLMMEDAALKPMAEGEYDYSDERSTRTAYRWLVQTDLVPTLLSGADGLTVIARSLSTAKPVWRAKAVLVSKGNQILGEALTAWDGTARFAPGLLRGKGAARPASLMLYGENGDFTLQDLERPAFDFSDRGADGAPQPSAMEAFIWTERGIYRPDEVVHAALLLRDRQARAVEGTPVTLIVRRPDGVEYKRHVLNLKSGGATIDVPLAAGARRGEWTLTAQLADGQEVLGTGRFEVQDFVPPKLRVTIDPPAADNVAAPGDELQVNGQAQFLYGAPGGGLAVGGTLKLDRDPEPFPAFRPYIFGGDAAYEGSIREASGAMTAPDGKATLTFPLTDLRDNGLALRATATMEVQEPGGRITKDSLDIPIRGAPLYAGLRPLFDDSMTKRGEDAGFEIVTLDRMGKPMAVPDLRWVLTRLERDYTWFNNGGGWSWRVRERTLPVATGTIATDATKPVRLLQRVDWGDYRMRLEDAAGTVLSAHSFYAGWFVPEDGKEGTPDRVTISQDRAAAPAGDKVQLKITPPFAGEMQVVIAGDRVHSIETQSVGAEPVTLDVDVDAAWGAGAYAMVSFVRPVEAKAGHRPVRAVGLAWIGVDSADRRMDVSIQAPTSIQPRQTVPVTVNVAGAGSQAFVTLAAVDEGILNLTRYKAPDPLKHYFAKRRLGLEMRDQYGRLLDGNAGPAGAIRQGGDADLGGGGLPVKSSRVVSLFSGMVPVAGGKAVIALEVPDFAGNLRLMAVAFDGTKLGNAQADMLVRDPVVAELVLPRFLAPDDRAVATLLLHNVEGAAGDYQVKVTPKGPLSVTAPLPATVRLAAGERQTLPVMLHADAAGIAGASIRVTGPGGIDITRVWDLSIRPAQAPVTLADVTQQAAGAGFTVNDSLLQPFQPGTASLSITYSQLPDIDVPGLLRDLNRYPYGCTEQTVSVAMPLLAFPDMAKGLGLDVPGTTGLRVADAIQRVLDRQKPDGSFGLWGPYDDYAGPWLQMYVFDFLTRARAAGHVVPDTALNGLADWAEAHVAANLNQQYENLAAAAYGSLVLARIGRGNIGDLRYLADRVEADARKEGTLARGPLVHAQLGAALASVGDRRRSDLAFARARTNFNGVGADYYSSRERDVAATLAIAAAAQDRVTLDAATAWLLPVVKQQRAWSWNTQQKGWLLLAAQALLVNSAAPEIKSDGVVAASSRSVTSFTPTPEQLARGLTLTNTATGAIWRSTVLKGVPKEAPPAIANGGVSLTRSYFRLDGTPLDVSSLPRNERIVVQLQGEVDYVGDLRTLVLVDPLPAGWEIETALKRESDGTAGLAWAGEVSHTALREGRDDRFVAVMVMGWSYPSYEEEGPTIAADLRLGNRQFRLLYLARAVTSGQFAQPPATVEDMYDSNRIARTESGTISVVEP